MNPDYVPLLQASRDLRLAALPKIPRLLDGLKQCLAILKQDAKVMQQQVAWASGKPGAEGLFLSVEAQTSASYGKLEKARELFKRSVAADQRDNLKANATSTYW